MAKADELVDQVRSLYYNSIVTHVAHFKRYPPSAAKRGEQGRTVVKFTIDSRENLRQSEILTSSCFAELDEEALATVRRAEPRPPVPSGLEKSQLTFDLPLVFAKNWRDAFTVQAKASVRAKRDCNDQDRRVD